MTRRLVLVAVFVAAAGLAGCSSKTLNLEKRVGDLEKRVADIEKRVTAEEASGKIQETAVETLTKRADKTDSGLAAVKQGQDELTSRLDQLFRDALRASFTYWPGTPTATQTVSFTDASKVWDSEILDWFWAFGDGTTSQLQNPTHEFTNAGRYGVVLKVTDQKGRSSSSQQVVEVSPVTPTVVPQPLPLPQACQECIRKLNSATPEQFAGVQGVGQVLGQALVDKQPYALPGDSCNGAKAIEELLTKKVDGVWSLLAERTVRYFCPELYKQK
jgi:outer membrane murein-binding lipoprotein Lpp